MFSYVCVSSLQFRRFFIIWEFLFWVLKNEWIVHYAINVIVLLLFVLFAAVLVCFFFFFFVNNCVTDFSYIFFWGLKFSGIWLHCWVIIFNIVFLRFAFVCALRKQMFSFSLDNIEFFFWVFIIYAMTQIFSS